MEKNIYACITESLCCTEEINTTLNPLCSSKKKPCRRGTEDDSEARSQLAAKANGELMVCGKQVRFGLAQMESQPGPSGQWSRPGPWAPPGPVKANSPPRPVITQNIGPFHLPSLGLLLFPSCLCSDAWIQAPHTLPSSHIPETRWSRK